MSNEKAISPGFNSQGAELGNEPPSISRRAFNYERHPEYPWLSKSGYENLGYVEQAKQNVRLSQWGREYTDHAIESTLPSGKRYSAHDDTKADDTKRRSIPPSIVERTIAYGSPYIDKQGRLNYSLGDITIGVSSTGRVHHASYRHINKPDK